MEDDDDSQTEEGEINLEVLPPLETAKADRAELIAKLEMGNKGDRRVAKRLSMCRKGCRCNLAVCAVCERRKVYAFRNMPAEAAKSSGRLYVGQFIAISSIVEGKRRTLNEAKVVALAKSIDTLGLQTPIAVCRTPKGEIGLLSGAYRLEVGRRLGWKTIPCAIFPRDKIENRLWQNSENFYRAELSVLDRADSLEELRYWTQMQLGKDGFSSPPPGYKPPDLSIKRTAKILGLTREEVRRSKLIAGISAQAKSKARECGLDNNQRALLEIARRPREEQARAVDEIVQRKRDDLLRHGAVRPADKETEEKIKTLNAKIHEGASDLAENRKHLRVIEDKLVVQGGLVPRDDDNLARDDRKAWAALRKAWRKATIVQAKLGAASPKVRQLFIEMLTAHPGTEPT